MNKLGNRPMKVNSRLPWQGWSQDHLPSPSSDEWEHTSSHLWHPSLLPASPTCVCSFSAEAAFLRQTIKCQHVWHMAALAALYCKTHSVENEQTFSGTTWKDSKFQHRWKGVLYRGQFYESIWSQQTNKWFSLFIFIAIKAAKMQQRKHCSQLWTHERET